jgi:hypothetical protein
MEEKYPREFLKQNLCILLGTRDLRTDYFIACQYSSGD